MIELDPSIIDQDSVRKKRRKKLILIALGPCIVLILAGIFFMRPAVFDMLFGMNFNNDDSGFIVSLGQVHKFANAIEPYIAYYEAGTAYIKDNDGIHAEAELRESLKNNPPQDTVCQVRVNLSYSIEMQADEMQIREQYQKALVLYNEAEGILYGDNCAKKNDSSSTSSESKDPKAETAKDRISDKRNDAVNKMNGESGGGEGGEGNDGGNGTEIDEQTINQLRNNLTNGNDVRSYVLNRLNGQSGSGAGGGSINRVPHW